MMRIHVEFLGFPMVSDVLGTKKMDLDIPGDSVKNVIDELIRRYGKKVEQAFYDDKGRLDVTLQMTLNGKTLISADQLRASLKDGDTLTFVLLLAGG
jgi:molybdopterin converting factor small subunit